MRWDLSRNPKVVRYLFELGAAGQELRAAIDSLQYEIPSDARRLPADTELWEWLEARHWIIFEVNRERGSIHIAAVESATVQ